MKLPEEEVRRRLVAQWLHKAETDLRAAESLLSQAPPLSLPSCFHSQQAAEKYLKAFLTWRQVEFPKTHAIERLLELAARADRQLAEELAETATLTLYGVEPRYHSDLPEPDLPEAAAALDLARKVRDVVLPKLPVG
jgi:HEPN domain-containing protein